MDEPMTILDDPLIAALLHPERLYTAAQAADRRSDPPRKPGLYAWYFDQIPVGIETTGCHHFQGWTLLYCGISPKKPPANGRAPSKAHIHQRIKTHFGGNAAGSTLRLTLGCLLEAEIGTVLRRVGTSGRYTFTNPGEQLLDLWMHNHARVAWIEHPRPWEPEALLIKSGLPLPLNIDGNPSLAHTVPLSAARRAARRRAEQLPLIADSGGPRRAR